MSKKQRVAMGTGEIAWKWEAECDILGCKRRAPLQWEIGEWILPVGWIEVEIVGARRRDDQADDDPNSRFVEMCPAHMLPDFRDAQDDELEDMPWRLQEAQREADEALVPETWTWHCEGCGEETESGSGETPPEGWVEHDESAYCGDCRKEHGL